MNLTARGLLAASLVMAAATPSRAQEKESVVVMPLQAKKLQGEALAAMNDLLTIAVTELSPFEVVTRADIEAQLAREQMKDMLACDAVACAAEIGGMLGTRYLLAGSVRKLGSKIIVTLSLIDTVAQNTKRGQGKVKNEEDLYEQAVYDAVGQVFGRKSPPPAAPAPPPVSSEAPKSIKKPERLTRSQIRAVVNANAAGLRHCYETELKRNPSLAGAVTAKITISPTGAVAHAKLSSSTLGSDKAETCMIEKIRTWQFPATSGNETLTVAYPFVFKPG